MEAGFINSDTDNQLFDDNFDDIALAIADGIIDTLQRNGLISDDMNSGNMGNPPGQENGTNRPGNDSEHSEGIPQYTVQAGAFRNGAYADRLQKELLEQDFPAAISQGGGLYRVTVGTFPTLDEAVDTERRLKRAGYQTVIMSS